ncbi:acetyl-CoA carboxylase biotin carboxyl carrier protein [bacterium]|jgi:acetyl-CoA carboxylase biotin carboxyl carrier protein|nr:acetyl-CoA carboxylase biotin carboxyl carrier protein [bacterium]MBT4249520.1 acetyl-CoA carboxylase biotin carboxyl carrier protein [bacterium]MBT4928102.1 acetyl-CoA carboxylase biotin carboxyl carrier protein [bacterium]MBT5734377.1 acetyl-CoA carboxylase biotin carboxyl carrier protein [bacterium]MBT6777128.1 acetyl-CoA carboxylase biotin carboxyl carrier protein [bacterium]
MWQDKVKEVINILENSNVNEIEITFWGRKIRVVKNASSILSNSVSATPETIIQNDKISNNMRHEDDTEKIDSGEKILSPMPGVFYSSQAPEKPPFVSEGDKVKVGQVLCIIESMKIMNEIESEFEGTIKKVLVSNSDPVEFNQPLFIVE